MKFDYFIEYISTLIIFILMAIIFLVFTSIGIIVLPFTLISPLARVITKFYKSILDLIFNYDED